jgi:hypothetical protein
MEPYVPRCRRHERYPFDDCPVCENEVGKRDPHEDGDESDLELRRYERWLDEMGGSR